MGLVVARGIFLAALLIFSLKNEIFHEKYFLAKKIFHLVCAGGGALGVAGVTTME